MDQFIFLFPSDENIIDDDFKYNFYRKNIGSNAYEKQYMSVLNNCISTRYRSKGFNITHVLMSDENISKFIKTHPEDKIVKTSMSSNKMSELFYQGKEYHVNPQEILNKVFTKETLKAPDKINLVVAGFHVDDCVEEFAKYTYNCGMKVLVDEDLTELLQFRMRAKEFKIDTYPSFDLKTLD